MHRSFLPLLVCAALVVSCSSKKDSAAPADGGGGGDDDASVADTGGGGTRVTDRGKVINFDDKKPLAGVTVSEGDVSTTTDASGAWSLTPLANTPVTLTFAAKDHITLTYMEVSISADTERETVDLLSVDTLHLVGGSLASYDNAKGVLFIGIKTLPSCADQTGATVTVDAPAGSVTNYILNGIPQKTQTAVAKGEDPGIAIYNVEIKTPVDFTVTHPTCTVVPLPYTDGTLTYSGKPSTAGGDATTYTRVFLK